MYTELKKLIEQQRFDDAEVLSTKLRLVDPDDKELLELERQVHNELTKSRLPGPTYLDWLKHIHVTLHPANYLEIGVESGQSLQFAQSPTKAIGIDPSPAIVHGTNAWVKIFKETSDDFFKNNNVKEILGNYIEFSFIDGLHEYDQVLKDFINIEHNSAKNTIITLHDIFPAIAATASREWNTFYWAGDTWKIMAILEKYRSDLTIMTIPAFPTGFGFITNLDPTNTVLTANFNSIVEEFKNMTYEQYKVVNLIENNFDNVIL
jgi:hypothetical protein